MASKQIYELDAGSGLDGTEVLPTQIAAGGEEAKKYTVNDVKQYSVPYKSYVATLTQNGTNNPTVSVLQNELSGDIVWTRNSIGIYVGTLSGAFTLNKTVLFINQVTPFNNLQAYPLSVNAVEIDNQDNAGSQEDGLFGNCIEIRVYY